MTNERKENLQKPTTMKKYTLAKLTLIATATLSLNGCQLWDNSRYSLHRYLQEEFSHNPASPKTQSTKAREKQNKIDVVELAKTSPKVPRDYILPNGKGVAIPAELDYDLYLSPFAPTRGYVQSKEDAYSEVICPFSKRVLILGDRDILEEFSPPQTP